MVTVAEPISPRHRQHRTAGNSFAQRNRRLSDDWFIGHCSPAIERSAGTDYAWNILYQGDLFNAVAATYNTPNGVLNPGQDSMLAPNPGMQMAGLSGYSQPTGFWGFYAQHEQGIQTGVAVTAGLAATVASFGILAPEAGAGIAAVIAAQAAKGAAGGFTTGYLESGFNGGWFTQNLEAGTINGGIGAAFGGGLSAAGIFAPYAGPALTSGFGSLYGGLTDAATAAGQYGGTFWERLSGPTSGAYANFFGAGQFSERLENGLRALSSDPAVQEAIENGELNVQALKQVTGIEEHHPIPEFMGGNADQELYPVSSWLHRLSPGSFHSLLAENLAASEEFTFPAVSAGQKTWVGFFGRYSGSQDVPYRILLETAQQMDAANGTDFASYVSQNIASGSYTPYPIEEAP